MKLEVGDKVVLVENFYRPEWAGKEVFVVSDQEYEDSGAFVSMSGSLEPRHDYKGSLFAMRWDIKTKVEPMKLEEGKYYRTRDGRKVGPMVYFKSYKDEHPWRDKELGLLWNRQGIGYCGVHPEQDIVEEWEPEVATEAEPEAKTWANLSDEEKGLLLLAHHEGKTIEFTDDPSEGWIWTPYPEWNANYFYRVMPEPVVSEMVLNGFLEGCGESWLFDGYTHGDADTHRITFNLIDGEPDCDSIKMYRL